MLFVKLIVNGSWGESKMGSTCYRIKKQIETLYVHNEVNFKTIQICIGELLYTGQA